MTSERDHVHAKAESNRLESLAVFVTVVRNRALLRVLAAYLLYWFMNAATWIAMLVYAYDRGGAAAAGVIAFAQQGPATLFAPAAAAFGDRLSRTRMHTLAYVASAASILLAAACLLARLDVAIVYVAAVVGSTVITLVRPAHLAVLPTLARTPSEATAANVASGTIETAGAMVGSLLGGLLLAVSDAGVVYLVGGLAALLGALVVAGMREAAPTSRRRRKAARALDGATVPVPDMPEAAAEEPRPEPVAAVAGRRMRDDIVAGLRAARDDAHVRAVLIVIATGAMLVGALDVLAVVLALDILDLGNQGVGLASGAIGAGGIIGSATAISLVGRSHLARPLLAAAAVFGFAVLAAGLVPVAPVAIGAIVVAGAGRVALDVACRTLLGRVAPDELLARIFGVVEGLYNGAFAIGTLVVPVLVLVLGPSGAFAAAGLGLPICALLLARVLVEADHEGVIHERELELLRRIRMLALLRPHVLEHLAAELEPVTARAGHAIIREGDPGDRFYIIDEGRCEVTIDGRPVRTMGPGDSFGEIALLNEVARTATVTALDDVALFALERSHFLEAVTGRPQSRAEAARVVADRLAAGGGAGTGG